MVHLYVHMLEGIFLTALHVYRALYAPVSHPSWGRAAVGRLLLPLLWGSTALITLATWSHAIYRLTP